MDAENKMIYLINYTFSENGRGVSTYAIRLYNELLKRNINVEKIATNDVLQKIKLGRELKNNLFFITRNKVIKGKFIHAMAPNVIPLRYLNLPKRKVVTVHDFYIFDDNYINKTKFRMSYINRIAYDRLIKKQRKDYYNLKDYDFVFAVSQEVLQRLVSDFGVDREKVEVSNDIIPDKFKPLNVEKDKNKVVIGFINNFTENKTEKLRLFIETFKKINDKNLEFHIYGKGFPFIDLIKDDNRIKYLGFLPEEKIVETYNSFDAYLSTSTVEGFGLPIMQAKACKIPVLCYDGDMPDLVKRNTLVWNDENLEEIIKNRSWEKIDVEKAYLDAEECRADKVVPKIIEVYEKTFN
jgi:hypothetical protein